MINEELIKSTPTKVTNGYRVALVSSDCDDIIITDYRSLSSALFHAGFDMSQTNRTFCKIYYIRKNVVTTLKHSYLQCYGKVY